MCARVRTALTRLRTDQSGQSLIIVALAMTVVIGVAALAIDVGSWYEKNHQTQVAADAAALAAANYCVTSASGSTPCSSATGSTAAQNVAIAYAAKNGVTLTANQVTVNTSNGTNTVTVKASSVAPAIFAGLFGVHSSTRRANSVAGWKTVSTSTPCSSAPSKSDCSAIYAHDTACSTSDGDVLGTLSGGATVNVTGIVHSEGEMTFAGTTNASALTVAGNCYTASNLPENDNQTMTATEVASQPWPVDYSQAPYFSACTPDVNCTTVQGIANVPPYCTQVSTSAGGWDWTNINGNPELPTSGNVYCAIGTGQSNDPSTWNGTFKIEASFPEDTQSCNSPYPKVTLIGGNVSIVNDMYGGGTVVCLSPAADNCLIYSTGNVSIYNGTFSWTGDIFDPDGTIRMGTAGNGGLNYASTSGMLEGNNVVMQNITLNLAGDGTVPAGTPGVSSSSSGTDALEQ